MSSSLASKPELNKTYQGDVRSVITDWPDSFIDLVVTSPPYFRLRKYTSGLGGTPDSRELGREQTVDEYVKALVHVFSLIKPKVKKTGSVWVNLDDTYRFGSPVMMPERFALAMMAAGFGIRNKIIWYKPDPQSESVTGRFTRKYEVFYWFTVEARGYYFDRDATNIPVRLNTVQRMEYDFHDSKQLQTSRMRGMVGNMAGKIADLLEGGTDCGDVWIVPTNKDKVAHKAPYPQQLIARPIIACCPEGGLVFDPFMGSGRTAIASNRLARNFIGTELSEEYAKLCNDEITKELGKYGQNIFLSEDPDYWKGTSWWSGKDEVQLELDIGGPDVGSSQELVVADPTGDRGAGASGPNSQAEVLSTATVPANSGTDPEGR